MTRRLPLLMRLLHAALAALMAFGWLLVLHLYASAAGP